MPRSKKSLVRAASLLLVLAAAAWWLWPAALGGSTNYVATHGVSMEPRFHTGDLAVMRPASMYRVGDIVAYHSDVLHTVVMHRIVAIHGGHYTFKGDNNTWLDPQPATHNELIGRLAFRVPHGGVWLHRLTSGPVLALMTFLLLTGGGGVTARRHRRRHTVARHAARPRSATATAVTAMSPQLRTVASVVAAVGVVGLTLGALAWTRPVDLMSTTSTAGAARSMAFSYTAAVAKSPAYDGTTVRSPDPVFRKLANTVDVHYTYRGTPGRIGVTATLSTPSGWHSTIPLAAPAAFTTRRYTGVVHLNLNALDARAQAAATATGMPSDQLTVTVTPTVRTGVGATFAPTLPLTVTPLQLTTTGNPKSLTVTDTASIAQPHRVSRTLGAAGHTITVATARPVSAVLVLLALVAAALLALIAHRCAPNNEATAIRRRYAALIVDVAPMPTAPGRPVVDVVNFSTLARLAERYALLVLHWTRSGVDTFVVPDDATTYRYRTGSTDTAREPHDITSQPSEGAVRDPR